MALIQSVLGSLLEKLPLDDTLRKMFMVDNDDYKNGIQGYLEASTIILSRKYELLCYARRNYN